MKTLDEVIEKIEEFWVCPSSDEADEYCDLMEVREDALQYLKEYRGLLKMWNDKLDKEQENQPLTWDELRTMEGKPVWVEALLYKQWAVIAYIGEEYIRFEGANLYAPECRIYMGEDNGWQAYRKERE